MRSPVWLICMIYIFGRSARHLYALTVHLVMPDGCPNDSFLENTAQELGAPFRHSPTLRSKLNVERKQNVNWRMVREPEVTNENHTLAA